MTNNTIIISRLFFPIEGGVETFLLEVAKSWDIGNKEVFCKREDNIQDLIEKPVTIRRFSYGGGKYWKAVFHFIRNFAKSKNKKKYFLFIVSMLINRHAIIVCHPFISESELNIFRQKSNLVIQCSMPIYTGIIGLYYKLMYGIPLVVYVHGSELIYHSRAINQNILQRLVFNNADLVISNSAYTTNLAITKGCDQRKIFKTLLGANTRNFFVNDSRSLIEKKYSIDKDSLILLTVSHLVPRKGADNVIRALPKIKQEIPDVKYLIGGRGEYLSELERLTIENEVSHLVHFLGFIQEEELNDLFNACDIFIMPNRQEDYDVEGFGIVFADAAACAKPTIAGNSGGAVDAIVDNETGFLVDPNSPDDIADKCIKLLKDEKLRLKFGQNGLKRVNEELNWFNVTAKIKSEIGRRI
jgi:phosphatidylinositol alpha-1,6-mannosyltransferase